MASASMALTSVCVGAALSATLVAGTAGAQSRTCRDAPSEVPREVVVPGVATLRVLDESAPSHGVTGAWTAALSVENHTEDWLRIELGDFELVREGHASSFARSRLTFSAAGRTHRGRRIRVPPRFRGEVRLEGRPRAGQILRHVDQWHRIALRVAGAPVLVRGCGLRYRHPRRRR